MTQTRPKSPRRRQSGPPAELDSADEVVRLEKENAVLRTRLNQYEYSWRDSILGADISQVVLRTMWMRALFVNCILMWGAWMCSKGVGGSNRCQEFLDAGAKGSDVTNCFTELDAQGPGHLLAFLLFCLTQFTLDDFMLQFIGAEFFTTRHRKFVCGLLLSRWVVQKALQRQQLPDTDALLKILIFEPINAQACRKISNLDDESETIIAVACFRALFGDKPVIYTNQWVLTLMGLYFHFLSSRQPS